MSEIREPSPPGWVKPWADIRTDGVLWAINRYVFHPRGFALMVYVADDGQLLGWGLGGDGKEPWTFTEDDDQASFEAFERFLAATRG